MPNDEIKETCFDHQFGAAYATLSSAEYPVINRMKKLAEKYPDEVQIVAENKDGSICAHVPWKWLKIAPPKSINMTDEEKAALAARLRGVQPPNCG